MTQSIRYRISAALVASLRAAPALGGVKVRHNPRDPASIKDGARVVFYEDQSDGFIDQPGQQAKRRLVFSLGVINRTADDQAGADADYVVAEDAIRAAYDETAATLAAEGAALGPLREQQVTFRVEGVDVGGALIVGTFEIEYRKPKPAR